MDHGREELQTIYLARHAETAWSLTGQHTGSTDLPLTDRGERNALRLGERLKKSLLSLPGQALTSMPWPHSCRMKEPCLS